ncbi:uncharacterized protein LOC144902500 [Branchiostoma floridae x Branchiostoma belcheri]
MNYLMYILLVITAIGLVDAESGLNAKQKSLITILAESRRVKWDAGEEYAIGELMRDVAEGVDPDKEDEEMKLGVERFADQVEKLSDEERGKVMKVFRQNLGKDETQTLFQDASSLAKEEDKKLNALKKDLGLQVDERKAFKELISDVIKGSDAEGEVETEKLSMAKAEEKVEKLTEDDKNRLRAMLASRYGEEQVKRIFNTAETIEKEEEDKDQDLVENTEKEEVPEDLTNQGEGDFISPEEEDLIGQEEEDLTNQDGDNQANQQ